ncbi:FKBP-type peptidyl-prolyl cis-trans isomerase [Pedobacter immunditicola]|uniref:FKBP-type peptidyl-prolyl cis-trans isomerase n=1 Tax=Pedobacter immunditicola TaxID=3133440 RepID=UPI0030AC736E
MVKNKILLAAIALVLSFSACQKADVYDREAQLQTDTEIIQAFVTTNALSNVQKHDGLFYQVLREGTGTETIESTDTVTVNYEGRLLDGTVFDKTTTEPIKFPLNGVIEGWQRGIPLMKKGGQIRLLIPSPMAYANFEVGGVIPANSPLDFTVELIEVNKKKLK